MARRKGSKNRGLKNVRPCAWGAAGSRERKCSRCRDWWPLTEDYYPRASEARGGVWDVWCHACHTEYRTERRAREKAARLEPEKGGAE